MNTRTLPRSKWPEINVAKEDLKEYLLAYHTVALMLLQGFDPDPYPSLKVTVNGEDQWSYGVEPFGLDVLRVILRSKEERGEVLVFVLLKEDDTWRLGDTLLAASEDDWARPAPQEEIQLALKALG